MYRRAVALIVLNILVVAKSFRNFPYSKGNFFLQNARFMAKKNDIRPTLDDIERISKGQAAKRRGTGSRAVPHRLNSAERKEWDLAKKRRFLLLRGTGWRKERGDSPLANIYRNYCDAVAVPSISVVRGLGTDNDTVIVDFTPLRQIDVSELAHQTIEEAKKFDSLVSIEDNSDITKAGWDNPEAMLQEDVIWRIPVSAVKASFTVRADAKKLAETLAVRFADGVSLQQKDDSMVME